MKTQPKKSTDTGELEFTGERYLPEVEGQIAFEHLHRYHFAAGHAIGKTVLDVACGEGYGTNILAAVAQAATGLDISAEAVVHARAEYSRENLNFLVGSAASLPFPDSAFDLVVSFETIEHHDQHQEMIAEICRVLRPGGLLIISSPNKQFYTIESGYRNPFHVKELFREEFLDLLTSSFKNVQLHGQRVIYGSVLVPLEPEAFRSFRRGSADDDIEASDELAKPHYDLALASDCRLPRPAVSIFEMSVHGLDPATFYGVHLPERLTIADSEVARLLGERSTLESERSAARLEFQTRIDALRNLHEQLAQEFREMRDSRREAFHAVAAEKEVRLQTAAEAKRQLESWLAELQLHANALEARRSELERELSSSISHAEGLKVELAKQDTKTRCLEERLEASVANAEALGLKHALAVGDHAALLQARMEELARSKDESRRTMEALSQAQQEALDNAAHAARIEEELRLVRASRSWRYTAMFRRAKK